MQTPRPRDAIEAHDARSNLTSVGRSNAYYSYATQNTPHVVYDDLDLFVLNRRGVEFWLQSRFGVDLPRAAPERSKEYYKRKAFYYQEKVERPFTDHDLNTLKESGVVSWLNTRFELDRLPLEDSIRRYEPINRHFYEVAGLRTELKELKERGEWRPSTKNPWFAGPSLRAPE